MNTKTQRLATFVIELRAELGLNQEQLAQKLGISRPTVSRWEAADCMPGKPKLKHLAQLRGWDEEYFQVYLNTGQKPTEDPLENILNKLQSLPAASVVRVIQEGARVLALTHNSHSDSGAA